MRSLESFDMLQNQLSEHSARLAEVAKNIEKWKDAGPRHRRLQDVIREATTELQRNSFLPEFEEDPMDAAVLQVGTVLYINGRPMYSVGEVTRTNGNIHHHDCQIEQGRRDSIRVMMNKIMKKAAPQADLEIKV